MFDFPERPKATDTNVMCPRCKEKNLKKGQWYYECDCGYKLSHTVAKVPITEEILQELLTTGKTRKKIVGFVSKAGNQFDTCLKYEDERISFDFDNPGEQDLPDESASGMSLGEMLEQGAFDNALYEESLAQQEQYDTMSNEEVATNGEEPVGDLPWN